jgi:transcriptional regulator of acetoin/glycerol metabolism
LHSNKNDWKGNREVQDLTAISPENLIMYYTTIVELAKECPNLNVTVKLGELLEMGNYCVQTTRKELEQMITDANTETYPSVEQTAKILDVDKSTLWRWRRSGYLTPIEVGGKRRYRMSDINKILEGGTK